MNACDHYLITFLINTAGKNFAGRRSAESYAERRLDIKRLCLDSEVEKVKSKKLKGKRKLAATSADRRRAIASHVDSAERLEKRTFSRETPVGAAGANIVANVHSQSAAIPQFDPEAFLAKVGPGHDVSDYDSGDVIFAQGRRASDVFFIRKGRVKITVVSRRGKEVVVSILSAGHFFGEEVLLGQKLHISTATAMNECTIARLSKSVMLRALRNEPVFSEFFITHLLSRKLRIEEDLVDQLFNPSEKRLARALLLLANFGTKGKPEVVVPDVTQETLAEMIGTTRSRVSFFLNKFRKLGYIEYNGQLRIHESLLNVVLND